MPAEQLHVQLSPLARSDLEGIWRYTAESWSPRQADTYYRQLVAALDGLAADDRIALPVDVRPGYWKYLAGSHVIYFRRLPAGIVVMRVLHQGMDVRRHL